ncbi:hypothetical protein J5J86_20365 [Aquabacter sp. L1I39]|uniref:hypothetical protein n=1 Tax=Aquabacter sp. L1I39 TaxID=2820278 RepID=UPI001ADD4B8A|nr:hypothetical protein [Aquabacter sp. L1I39]QTL03085.1 hypothetical protein J5J86_20365 [Aquabacter sp. L1I39]
MRLSTRPSGETRRRATGEVGSSLARSSLSSAGVKFLPAVMLAAGLCVPGASARAQDGDFFQNILATLGVVEGEKPDIQYRERAPLVVPPGTAASSLPPPKEGAAVTNPNWPKDYDLQRAQAAKADDKTPLRRDDPGNPLLPSQLNNPKFKPLASNRVTEPNTGRARDELMPSELGFKGWNMGALNGPQDKPLVFTGEPTREALTQPPPGYQTPAPNAPYGTVEKKEEPFKLPSFFDLQNTSSK